MLGLGLAGIGNGHFEQLRTGVDDGRASRSHGKETKRDSVCTHEEQEGEARKSVMRRQDTSRR